MSTSAYTDPDPENLFAIEALAEEIDRPVAEVEKAFARNFERLSMNARIKDYLIVLTCKKVREELRK